MKTNTTIKRDVYGLYVRTGGCVYRPVVTKYFETVFQPMSWEPLQRDPETGKALRRHLRKDYPYTYTPDPDMFVEGEPVFARHQSYTTYARVASLDGREAYWPSHGAYLGKKSHECWAPYPTQSI